KTTGSNVLLANTYHLLLRPGPEVFEKFGGIHRFMNWDRPVLTDSGGFQIFSLPHSRAMNEDGAHFQSYVDGRTHLLSPESSIATQRAIGSDIMMVLDQCIPSTADHATAEAAMHLTHRWAERSLRARGDSPQALFGIVQGACHADLRQRSAEFLQKLPFDGLAIGGLAVGETHEERYRFTGIATDFLPEDRPRYLMGVGTPIDILEAVHRGVDMFDCIIPSQVARRGVAFTSQGRLQLRRGVYKFSEDKLDPACDCAACRDYSRAYLHHLTKADENLGWHLLSVHNFTFYHRLTAAMRAAILRDEWTAFYDATKPVLLANDENHPGHPPHPPKTPKRRRLGDYEIHDAGRGFNSIKQISSGEIMHSVNPPEEESERVYIGQSALADRIQNSTTPDPLVVWDVGLGAAHNAMAALACFERALAASSDAPALRPVRLVSFERDLDPLRLAARNPAFFPHLRHGAPQVLLKDGRWSHPSGLFEWELRVGDFRETYPAAALPDLIYYDPFSAKTDAPLWTAATFADLRAFLGEKSAELYTYSAATAVRVTLLAAGYHVAEGVGTGPKSSTTVAFNRPDGPAAHPAPPALLGADWLGRWSRSHPQFPADLPEEKKAAFAARITGHPQFAAARATGG